MSDFQLIGFLLVVAASQLEALLIPIGLAVAALASAAPLNFEPVEV